MKLTVISERRKEAMIALRGWRMSCSKAALSVSDGSSTDRLRSAENSKDAMARVLRDEHALSTLFVGYLLARTSRIQAELVDQLCNNGEND